MNSPAAINDKTLAEIQQSAYLRERLRPRPGDGLYLHLSDLRQALQPFASDEQIKVLDYGSGGSPYRSQFPNADYRRADFDVIDGLDYILDGEDATIPEPDATFDLILSTQVAEHLRWPQRYFSECRRLLKPGGQLICTTHGNFEEHGVPYDYQRWTAAGLRALLEDSGFEVEQARKLTTGPRALLFQFDCHLNTLKCSRRTLWGFTVWVGSRLYGLCQRLIHIQADKYYGMSRSVDDSKSGHQFYIALLLVVRKPN